MALQKCRKSSPDSSTTEYEKRKLGLMTEEGMDYRRKGHNYPAKGA